MAFKAWRSDNDQESIRIPAIGLELHVRLPREATDGAMEVIETVNAPGFGPPRHRHGETEIFRVLAGQYLYEMDGQRFYANPGDMVCIPGGTPHCFVNVSNEPARQLVMILPGLDASAFFSALGALMQDGLPSSDSLNHFGEAWGMEFLGLPLRAS